MSNTNSNEYCKNYKICRADFENFLTEYQAPAGKDVICPYYSFVLIHSIWYHAKEVKQITGAGEAKTQLCILKSLLDGELPKEDYYSSVISKDDLEKWHADNAWFAQEQYNGKPTIVDAYPINLGNDPGQSKEQYCGFVIKDNSKGIFPLILYPHKFNLVDDGNLQNNRSSAMISSINNILENFDAMWSIISIASTWNESIQSQLYSIGIKRDK